MTEIWKDIKEYEGKYQISHTGKVRSLVNNKNKIRTQPKILNYVDKKYNDFIENKGYFPEMFNPYHTKEVGDIAPTQTTQCGSTTSSSTICINNGARVRKLTPLECWRLMSFDDEDFYKAQSTGNSNSQLYKQAGNSIVVKVLEKIFKNLLTLN